MDNAYDMRLYIKLARVTVGQKVDDFTFAYQKPVSKQVTKVNGVTVRQRLIPSYYLDTLPTKEILYRYQNGKTLTSESGWSYDDKGNVLTETVPLAGTTTMTYDSGNYSMPLSKTYKKDDRTEIREVYTPRSDRKAVEWKRVYESSVLKEAVSYSYDSANNLISERHYANLASDPPVASANDRVISYSYANTNPNLSGAIYNNVFLTETKTAGIKDADGNNAASTLEYPAGTVAEKYVFDAHGRMLEKMDAAGKTTKYQYDALGRSRKEIFPRGNASEPEYFVETEYLDVAPVPKNHIVSTDEKGQKTRHEYTSLGKIERVYTLSPDTLLSRNLYDSENRLWYEYVYGTDGTTTTVYAYDDFSRATSKTVTGPNMPGSYEERYSYDDAFDPAGGTMLEGKQVMGNHANAPTIHSCVMKDVLGRTVRETVGDSTGIASSGITSVTYGYDFVGNKTSQTDSNGNTTTWTYDYAGRTKTETRQTEDGPVTAHTVYTPFGDKDYSLDFRGKRTDYDHDALGRLRGQTSALNGSDKMIARYFYDPVGNVEKQQLLCGGTASAPVWKETRYTYDSRYRVLDTITHDGTAESRCRFQYDPVGNKTAQYTGMTGNSVTGAAKTSYDYDRFGNVKSITDSIGNSPNPTAPERRTETYTYDNYGMLRQKKDRSWFVTAYRNDALGRLCRETVTDTEGQQPELYRAFTYYKTGLKATEENEHLSVSFAFDARGRLISQTETCRQGAANTVVKRYSYDDCGNRTGFTMTKDGGAQLSMGYVYGKRNMLKEVWRNPVFTGGVISGGQKIAVYTYDANGNRKTLAYPQSGMSVGYEYNDANLVTDLYNRKGGGHRSSYHYTYYPDGTQRRKTAKVSGKADKVTDYRYDRMGRLTEEKEQKGSTAVYAYDRYGNRQRMTVTDVNGKVVTTDYIYDIRNRLETETKEYDGTTEILRYRYDWNGNQVHRQWEKFTPTGPEKYKRPGRVGIYSDKFCEDIVVLEMQEYNGFNQLTYVYRDTVETRYQYRPDGLRHRKLFADGSSTTHIWDGQDIIAEYGQNGAVHSRYLRGLSLIARDVGGNLEYYLFNAHGDVVERTSANGTTLKNYDYDAFGVERNPEKLDANPYRYCGEYLDRESGTVYLRARGYDPNTGRFLTEDTHWNPSNMIYGDAPQEMSHGALLPNGNAITQSSNLYNYCGHNPILYSDVSGGFFVLASLIVGIAAGAAVGALYSQVTYGEVTWQSVAIGALIGGAAGLAVGLGGAYIFGGAKTIGAAMTMSSSQVAAGLAAMMSSTAALVIEAGKSVWEKGATIRGQMIERFLGGMNTNFPVIDKFTRGANDIAASITSIKSMDLAAKTYQKAGVVFQTIMKYGMQLSNFDYQRWNNLEVLTNDQTMRFLELAIPQGATSQQLLEMRQATIELAKLGVQVIVHIFQ